MNIYKFTDPISDIAISLTHNHMYTASWDKLIRIIDLEANKAIKSFVGAREAIKCILVTDTHIFVAGCDPVIHGFNLETGTSVDYEGHKGWVYCLKVLDGYLFSGGDDKTVKVWNIETGQQVEELLKAH